MIAFSRRLKVYAATRPTDMRKSFDALAEIVRNQLGMEPGSGDIFLFVNARCTHAKALLYDGTGLCVYSKRLERNRFAAPWKRSDDGVITLSSSELALFLEGSQLVFVGALSPPDVEPNPVATKAMIV